MVADLPSIGFGASVAYNKLTNISRAEIEGTAGTINHQVVSQYDQGYDDLLVPGIDLFVASAEEGAVVIAEGPFVTVEDLPAEIVRVAEPLAASRPTIGQSVRAVVARLS